MQNYYGALLLGDTNVRVITTRGEIKDLPISFIKNYPAKKRFFRGSYKRNVNRFYSEIQPDVPEYLYTVHLSNALSFICGQGNKCVVYSRGSTSYEMLPIEIIAKNTKGVYIAHENAPVKAGNLLPHMDFNAIEEIECKENTDKKPVYRVWFKFDSPSTLMVLSNGIIIRGSKEER
jgi:hypothetical protein